VSALSTIASQPDSQDIYTTLTAVLDQIGDYDVQDKKTSLHITHGRAFGVHPRANGLLLNIVTTTALPGPPHPQKRTGLSQPLPQRNPDHLSR
jgi:hypothetical protein